jgi:hypothetical protein
VHYRSHVAERVKGVSLVPNFRNAGIIGPFLTFYLVLGCPLNREEGERKSKGGKGELLGSVQMSFSVIEGRVPKVGRPPSGLCPKASPLPWGAGVGSYIRMMRPRVGHICRT